MVNNRYRLRVPYFAGIALTMRYGKKSAHWENNGSHSGSRVRIQRCVETGVERVGAAGESGGMVCARC